MDEFPSARASDESIPITTLSSSITRATKRGGMVKFWKSQMTSEPLMPKDEVMKLKDRRQMGIGEAQSGERVITDLLSLTTFPNMALSTLSI
jgi:hypothetical protein